MRRGANLITVIASWPVARIQHWVTLLQARAIENQVYLVASGYDHPTYIMNPSGEWLATARERGSAAVATIDLNKPLRQPDNNMGDMRNRLPKELRLDVPTGIPGAAK